jgi:hypothetical protein
VLGVDMEKVAMANIEKGSPEKRVEIMRKDYTHKTE